MSWQTIALYGAGVIGAVIVAIVALRMFRKEARTVGGEREARETLEKMVEADKKSHELDGIPIPLSRRRQLNRLRALLDSVPHNRDPKMSDDE